MYRTLNKDLKREGVQRENFHITDGRTDWRIYGVWMIFWAWTDDFVGEELFYDLARHKISDHQTIQQIEHIIDFSQSKSRESCSNKRPA